MFIPAVAALFKHKVIGSIIIIANWSMFEKIKAIKQFSQHGIRAAYANDPTSMGLLDEYRLQGVLYVSQTNDSIILNKVHTRYFSNRYKWLLVGNEIQNELCNTRYDSDIVLIRNEVSFDLHNHESNSMLSNLTSVSFHDVYIHPGNSVSIHAWARWSPDKGLVVYHDWERILRRRNLRKYPLRITAPLSRYSKEIYKGEFSEYLVDWTAPDFGLRCGYGAASLLIEYLNATEVIIPTMLWISEENNSSMILMLEAGTADLSAGILRVMQSRLHRIDYVMPIWMFSVGFTYLAERESSSNMYVEPFTVRVWFCCLAVGVTLAVAQWLTSKNVEEKEGAFIGVLATWLQQDASAVPGGLSGRWNFTVLSVCSMLVHAYYTSAIVSSLMSSGRGGPRNLRQLADSRYAIASDNHDFYRSKMFDVKTTWPDLEYLKRKKMDPSKFYQNFEYGIQLIQQGATAYHGEYHSLYPYLNTFSDVEICKMQQIDTVPEIMTWILASPKGQYTNLFRSASAWLKETGLAKRLLNRIRIQPPPCMAAMLAERVTFWDVSPLLAVTALAAVMSFILLGLEIVVANWRGNRILSSHHRNRILLNESI